jgi:eukaryotic-like serine/threonine-protein kinase
MRSRRQRQETMTVLEIQTPDPRAFDETSRPFVEAVASRYAVKKLIGRGGMGVVYLARDRRLERLVAIKTLPPHLAADETTKQRFLREIRTAGAMSHPNVVPIHGADEIDGHVFFVMGYVDGESLAAMIRGMGRLEAQDTARILRDVAAALTHSHSRGIIHRDIKAENILVERATGRAMVTDFGIARLTEASPLTQTGQILGTVYYVSPEQVAGEKIDSRSDIYSLGIAGFLALTGTFPFDAELASAVLVAHVNKPAPPVRTLAPSVPAGLASIVDRCLAKDPSRRYESAEKLVEALDAYLANGSHAPASIPKPKLVSDTEAQAVWGRAAALQASTGVQPRSDVIPKLRDDRADAARTSGLAVDDIRSAGREAGITTRHMDRALVEHGLAPSPTTTVRQPSAWWAGIPLKIVEQTRADGEVDAARFDAIVNLLRDGTGELGEITAARRELGWRAEWFGSDLTVSVVPSEGQTSIRAVQRIGGLAAATMGSFMTAAAVAAPIISVAAFNLMAMPTPRWLRSLSLDLFMQRSDRGWIALGIGIAAFLTSIPISRAINRLLHRQQARRLYLLVEAVAAKAGMTTERD